MKLNSGYPKAYVRWGRCSLSLGDLRDAEDAFCKVPTRSAGKEAAQADDGLSQVKDVRRLLQQTLSVLESGDTDAARALAAEILKVAEKPLRLAGGAGGASALKQHAWIVGVYYETRGGRDAEANAAYSEAKHAVRASMWSVRAGNVMGTTRHHAALCYVHAEARTRLFAGRSAAERRGAVADLTKAVEAAHSIAPLLLGRAQSLLGEFIYLPAHFVRILLLTAFVTRSFPPSFTLIQNSLLGRTLLADGSYARAESQLERATRNLARAARDARGEARKAQLEDERREALRLYEEARLHGRAQTGRHMTPMKDHFETLGVSPSAGVKTVRKAYRRTARECHPDKVRGDAQTKAVAEERFKEVAESYSELQKMDGTPKEKYRAKIQARRAMKEKAAARKGRRHTMW